MQMREEDSRKLWGRRIIVVVTGGIAAYKIGFVVRDLIDLGASVSVAMTRNATEFVGPATFEALTGEPVYLDMFDRDPTGGVEHVGLARSVDAVLVAPATANVLAKMACGIADDAATTLLLATTSPIVVAPAMNDGMWKNPATVENMTKLEKRGVRVASPEVGFLAEGYESVGRMAEPAALVEAVLSVFEVESGKET